MDSICVRDASQLDLFDGVEHLVVLEEGRPLPRRVVPLLVLEVAVDLPLSKERPVAALGVLPALALALGVLTSFLWLREDVRFVLGDV